jgi:hypothetical protein
MQLFWKAAERKGPAAATASRLYRSAVKYACSLLHGDAA